MTELPETYLKIAEAAALFNIPVTSLRDYATAGRVQHTRIGRHIRFSPEDIEAIRVDGVRPVHPADPPRRAARPVTGSQSFRRRALSDRPARTSP